ncbi:MAG: phosphoadenylyl-sulfate reductase [Candidatus Omnitrophota bacterium]|jgi:phosphoadenosine phosphosulfate reductase
MQKQQVESDRRRLEPLKAEEVLREVFKIFNRERIALASSLAAEDQVLTDMVLKARPGSRIFTLDTGRLPQETYRVIEATAERYSFRYEVLFPDTGAVEKMVSENGPNLFYASRENRQLCCRVRKVEPLRRQLAGLDAWICGLRRDQAVTRAEVSKIEWDEANGLVKINPLADWTAEDVWNYIHAHNVPYNALHDQGYPSIGCAPCTRAVKLGEDARAGRWWWERPDQKECGLHRRK